MIRFSKPASPSSKVMQRLSILIHSLPNSRTLFSLLFEVASSSSAWQQTRGTEALGRHIATKRKTTVFSPWVCYWQQSKCTCVVPVWDRLVREVVLVDFCSLCRVTYLLMSALREPRSREPSHRKELDRVEWRWSQKVWPFHNNFHVMKKVRKTRLKAIVTHKCVSMQTQSWLFKQMNHDSHHRFLSISSPFVDKNVYNFVFLHLQ